ncbi:MAG: STAS domain-containing protein [Deltaproteobacteria bacterium]|jgi:anti-anti-sigma factor|nr:STAS domain-containing protein [Deltaproteobacteria bacterium]
MQTSSEMIDDVLLVSLEGKITGNNSSDLEKSLKAQVDQGRLKIVLDFAAVEYISSAGLRVVLWLAKQLKGKNGGLSLCRVSQGVMDIFKMCGFVDFLSIFDSREAALENLK